MNNTQCEYCKSYNTNLDKNIFLCLNCNNYYVSKDNKSLNNIKNYSNKEAHFKNILKTLNTIGDNNEISQNVLSDIKNKLIEGNAENIDIKYLNYFLKKNKLLKKKNYILYYMILCHIKNETPILDAEILLKINILFYDFINFMTNNNIIEETISYQLFLNIFLSLMNITTNFNPNISKVKDSKMETINKYLIHICSNKMPITYRRERIYNINLKYKNEKYPINFT